MKKKLLLLVALAAAALIVGATVGYASGSAAHSRSKTSDTAAALITGQSTGGGCRMGYDTQTSENVPPDDTNADNAPAASVTINKPCAGAVIGQFTSEVGSTPTADHFISLDMRATCTGRGGFANPCTVGQQVYGSPLRVYLKTGPAPFGTSAMNTVWSGLRRGIWRFEVLPGGNNVASLHYRTFHVEAFAGG